MGSAAWLESRGVGSRRRKEAESADPLRTSAYGGSIVHVAIDGKYRGCFAAGECGADRRRSKLVAGLSRQLRGGLVERGQ